MVKKITICVLHFPGQAVPQLMHELYLFVVRFFVFAVKNPHLGSRSEVATITSAGV